MSSILSVNIVMGRITGLDEVHLGKTPNDIQMTDHNYTHSQTNTRIQFTPADTTAPIHLIELIITN